MVSINIPNTKLFRYAKCAKVSKKKFTNCENTISSTPIRIGLSILTFFEIKNTEPPIIPKIPPKDQYNMKDSGGKDGLHLTANRRKSFQENEPFCEVHIKA
ncbi:MAG: hypothetical protein WD966_06965 [Nitrosopumilaceae archaeon]